MCLCVCVYVCVLCVYVFIRVCVCIYYIAHNHAIRGYHPSHSFPLALVFSRGVNDTFHEHLSIEAKEDILSIHFYLSPDRLAPLPLLPCYPLGILDRHVLTLLGFLRLFVPLRLPPVPFLASHLWALVLRITRRSCWASGLLAVAAGYSLAPPSSLVIRPTSTIPW